MEKIICIAILYGIIMFIACFIITFKITKELKNNVHFYVARDKNGDLYLYMGKPVRGLKEFLSCYYGKSIKSSKHFSKYGLNVDDYAYLKWEDDPVEVFINMEDCV